MAVFQHGFAAGGGGAAFDVQLQPVEGARPQLWDPAAQRREVDFLQRQIGAQGDFFLARVGFGRAGERRREQGALDLFERDEAVFQRSVDGDVARKRARAQHGPFGNGGGGETCLAVEQNRLFLIGGAEVERVDRFGGIGLSERQLFQPPLFFALPVGGSDALGNDQRQRLK